LGSAAHRGLAETGATMAAYDQNDHGLIAAWPCKIDKQNALTKRQMLNDHLLTKTLQQYHSVQWLNQYFDLLKKLLTELDIENDNPRLAMSLTTQKTLPVNLGQRYVLKPQPNERVRAVVPLSFEEEVVNGTIICYFKRRRIEDAKWIEIEWKAGSPFPPVLYNACVEECMDILHRCMRSGYRKYHVPDLYQLTMEPAVRNEILQSF
jgi:hypothetical protein